MTIFLKNFFLGLCLIVPLLTSAQEIPVYSHYFMNPYLYNPSYAGSEGRGVLFLTHRRQWVGIEGAPVTSNFTYHGPLSKGVSLGFNINHDERSILTSTNLLMTLGYNVRINWNQNLRFGISGGAGFNTVDLNELDFNDPAFADLLDNNVYLDGNAGISYHIGGFNLGVALPRIFRNRVVNTEQFEIADVSPMDDFIAYANMRFYMGETVVFEPRLYYRHSQDSVNSQWEASGVFHFSDAVWTGIALRDNYGFTGLAGIKTKGGFAIGYSFGFGGAELVGIGTDFQGLNAFTHEIQLSLGLGQGMKRPRGRPASRDNIYVYSFVDTERPIKPEKPDDEIIVKKDSITDVIKPDDIIEEDTTRDEVDTVEQIVEDIPVEDIPNDTTEVIEDDDDEIVVVEQGSHRLELPVGHYVVAGAFGNLDNAQNYSDRLFQMGYNASFGYLTEKNLYYVFVHQSNSPELARNERDRLRQNSMFSEVWHLQVTPYGAADSSGPSIPPEESREDEPSDEEPREEQETETITRTEPETGNEMIVERPEGDEPVVVRRGGHILEMPTGHYVIAGAFKEFDNAEEYSDRLFEMGYHASFGYLTNKELYYVFLTQANSEEAARNELGRYKQKDIFNDAWYLVVTE